MSRFLHKNSNKERVKVHFELTIKTAENVPSTGNVYVQWKRGKKSENKGETKHVPVGKDKKAVFEELVEISATLYKIPKKGYESKNISLALKEEKGKKGSSIAKTVIDLAEFAGNRDENRSFSLKSKKSKVAPTLTLHFKSKEREIAPDEDVTETDNVTEENLSDEEEDVEDFTDDTKDDVSSNKSGKSSSSKASSSAVPTPTLTSTPSSDAKAEGKRDSRRDSVSSISSTSSSSNINLNTNDIEELRAELEKAKKREADLKKRSRELATENVDFEEKIKDLNKEIDNLKKSKSSPSPGAAMSPDKEVELRNKIKELSMENNELEDTISKLKKEIEEAKASAAVPASPAMTSEKEAQMKARMRELATENVDLEEQVSSLKKQLEEAKNQGGKKSDKEDGLQKQVQELNDRIKEKDGIILSQKQELENRIKEKDSTILSQKQEIDNLKKGSSDNKLADKEELRKKIKDLIKANEETEEEVEALKKQVQELKKTSSSSPPPASLSVSTSISSDEAKRLQNEIHDKDDKVRDLEREIEKLKSQLDDKKRDLNKSSGSDVSDLKNTIASQKSEIERLKKDLEKATLKKGSANDLGRVEDLSRSNKELQDSADELRKSDREKYEKDIEKERDARKKAEKEARETREQLRELEDKLEEMELKGSQGAAKSNSTHALPNGKDDAKLTILEKELEHEKEIVAAVFAGAGTYSEKEGVSQSAVQVWSILRTAHAYTPDDSEGKAVADRVMELLKTACTCTPNEMNMLFYWLSTTCALLHMLRDEPDVHSNNDRDPIIDGVYQPAKEPSASKSDLQDRLEWLAFIVYKQLVTVICTKLTPVLAPVIIERPLTDKKTQVKTSSVMRILDRVLARTRHHYLYDAVTQQLFVQIFYFINCHLVNTILKKDKLTPSIGFQIKLGISHLEDWIAQPSGSSAERTLLAPCSAQLDGMRDVGGVLVLDKGLFSDASTLQTIFRTLGLRQIKRLLEVFEPDQLAPQGGTSPAMPMNVRDAVASTWGNREAASQPLLLDAAKIIEFSPQLD